MTDNTHPTAPKRRGTIPAASILLLMAALGGCASGPEEAMRSGPQSGPIDTGTYPNLNVPPESAAAPISDADKAGLTSRLAGAKARQVAAGRGIAAPDDPNRLKKIAVEHGPDTLKAIEAQ